MNDRCCSGATLFVIAGLVLIGLGLAADAVADALDEYHHNGDETWALGMWVLCIGLAWSLVVPLAGCFRKKGDPS